MSTRRILGCCPRAKSHQVKIKKNLIYLCFYFSFFPLTISHFIINITRLESPQVIPFDTCLVTLCRDLHNQKQLASSEKYLCPGPPINLTVSHSHRCDQLRPRHRFFIPTEWQPCSSWNDVLQTTQYRGWTSLQEGFVLSLGLIFILPKEALPLIASFVSVTLFLFLLLIQLILIISQLSAISMVLGQMSTGRIL